MYLILGATAAGVDNLIDFNCNDIDRFKPEKESKFILTNPPWDVRLEGVDLCLLNTQN
jgi:23S rRNA G2445 N2-methylase RlmL